MIHKGGFKLIEILILVALLGILPAVVVPLAVLAVPQFSGVGMESRTSTLVTDLRRVGPLIEPYRLHHNDQLPAVNGEIGGGRAVRQSLQDTNAAGPT